MNAFGIALIVLSLFMCTWTIWHLKWLGVYIVGIWIGAALVERWSVGAQINQLFAVGVFLIIALIGYRLIFRRALPVGASKGDSA
jgi:hypothetical protein